MKAILSNLVRGDDGQDLIEYGLLAALISIIAIVAITSVGSSLQTTYTSFSSTIPAGS
jgi:pilus assembly protein Flp/PilA